MWPEMKCQAKELRVLAIFIVFLGLSVGYSWLRNDFPFSRSVVTIFEDTPHQEDGSDDHQKLLLHNLWQPSSDIFHHMVDNRIAKELERKVRVLCWVATQPENHKKKAAHVKDTWGSRCNKLIFMSSINDTLLPSVPLPVNEGRDNLWAKTKEAFSYVYKNYYNEYDWFMKADDDTYVILENLRFLLKDYKTSEPIYFGQRLKRYVKQGFMGGGSGYVLSKEALRRFVEEGLPDGNKCRQDSGGYEDVEMGKCLEAVGVEAMDSRDRLGRGRFFMYLPMYHFSVSPRPNNTGFWYWRYTYYPIQPGMKGCSDFAISFHYISPDMMHLLEYLIYNLKPYGIQHIFFD